MNIQSLCTCTMNVKQTQFSPLSNPAVFCNISYQRGVVVNPKLFYNKGPILFYLVPMHPLFISTKISAINFRVTSLWHHILFFLYSMGSTQPPLPCIPILNIFLAKMSKQDKKTMPWCNFRVSTTFKSYWKKPLGGCNYPPC